MSDDRIITPTQHFAHVIKTAKRRPDGYPFDLPGSLARLMPSLRIPLLLHGTTTNARDYKAMSDVDESGLIAIHEGRPPDHGYTVTHPPTGVCYLQNMTLTEALDLSHYLAARLDRIKRLVLDSQQRDPTRSPSACLIIDDPGKIGEAIDEWIERQKIRGK